MMTRSASKRKWDFCERSPEIKFRMPPMIGCKRFRGVIASLSLAFLAACGDASPPLRAPIASQAPHVDTQPERTQTLRTRKDDTVDVLSGIKVADPYRWLEDGESPETKAWTDQENATTRAYLDAIAGREALAAEVTSLLH